MKSQTKYRKPIYITNEHLELYKELAAKGFTLTQARKHEQQIFNMPEAHSEQAVRSRCQTVGISFRRGKRGKGQTTIKRIDHELTWSEQQETLLQCLLMAKKGKDLEEDNWRLKNRIGALEAENKNLSEKTDYERRYNLAVQQGDIKPPLKHSNFTEHIKFYSGPAISDDSLGRPLNDNPKSPFTPYYRNLYTREVQETNVDSDLKLNICKDKGCFN